MTNVESVKKAFHKAVIEYEQLLRMGKITFEDFQGLMLSFEAELTTVGVNI